MYGHQIDNVTFHTINQAVAALENLTIGVRFILLNVTAKQRLRLQEFGLGNELLAKTACRQRCVSRDILEQRFKIVEGPIRPN